MIDNLHGSTGYEFPYHKESFGSRRGKKHAVCESSERSLNPSQVERSFQNGRSQERIPVPNREQLRAYFEIFRCFLSCPQHEFRCELGLVLRVFFLSSIFLTPSVNDHALFSSYITRWRGFLSFPLLTAVPR